LDSEFVTAISCYDSHCAALTREGKVVCWGDNTFCQSVAFVAMVHVGNILL
jgi:alpha-tubulin suppressor-like RCC1 family protein